MNNDDFKIVGVVPIKLNNQRAKDKNLRKIFGKPLVTAILEKLISIDDIFEVYCYCSDERIKKYMPEGSIWKKRPIEYDSWDITSDIFFKGIGEDIQANTHVICNATAPFLKTQTIKKCLNIYLDTLDENYISKFDSVCTVQANNGRMWQNNKPVLTHDGWICPRSQDIAPVYIESEGCWVIDSNILKNSGRRIGDKPYFVPVSNIECIDFNTEEDWNFIKTVEKGMLN